MFFHVARINIDNKILIISYILSDHDDLPANPMGSRYNEHTSEKFISTEGTLLRVLTLILFRTLS
jgi:hypothetical protein